MVEFPFHKQGENLEESIDEDAHCHLFELHPFVVLQQFLELRIIRVENLVLVLLLLYDFYQLHS